jgi:hypothetical protein
LFVRQATPELLGVGALADDVGRGQAGLNGRVAKHVADGAIEPLNQGRRQPCRPEQGQGGPHIHLAQALLADRRNRRQAGKPPLAENGESPQGSRIDVLHGQRRADHAELDALENMAAIGQLNTTERVAYFLLQLGNIYATRLGARPPLHLRVSRQQIAEYLGMKIETMSRSFAKLKARGLIALIGLDTVVIQDREKLEEFACLPPV